VNIEEIREHCLAKTGVTEGLPFGEDVLVFKVSHKIFVLANLEGQLRISLKCNPELAIDLRERYRAVLPGYHMNKKHWNTVIIDGSISDEKIIQWIDHSYEAVSNTLPSSKK